MTVGRIRRFEPGLGRRCGGAKHVAHSDGGGGGAGQERRAAELEERIEELERLGPGSGVLDVHAEDWGPSAKSDNVLVRARHGKRAALASLGNGYYLVREVGPEEPQAAVQTEMSRAATLAAPALSAIQAVSGDAYPRCKCQGGSHG